MIPRRRIRQAVSSHGHISRRTLMVAGASLSSAGLLNACSTIERSVRVDQTGLRRTQFLRLVKCRTRTLYVAGWGDDNNSGSQERPFREISTAVRSAVPGTLILVDSGIYGRLDVIDFRGRPDGWLGIMTANVNVKAYITAPPPTGNFVNFITSSYVGLYGFEIFGDLKNPNTNCSGISVYGNSHHIIIWANSVHDFPAGGINCFNVDGSHDMVDMSYNRIYRTSFYSPNNCSGISIFEPRDLTGGDVFPGGYGYRVVGNYIYNVMCTVPYRRLGFVTDGNGICADKAYATYGYRKRMLVNGNIITGCGGHAIHVFKTINVDVLNNTVIGNLRTESPALSGHAEIDQDEGGINVVSNIICPLNTATVTQQVPVFRRNVILGGTQPVPPDNFDLKRKGLRYFVGPVTRRILVAGSPSLECFLPARQLPRKAGTGGGPDFLQREVQRLARGI